MVLTYIIIGLIWTAILELMSKTDPEAVDIEWTMWVRFLNVVFWFISLGAFIYGFVVGAVNFINRDR